MRNTPYSGGWNRRLYAVEMTPGWVARPSDDHEVWDREADGARPPTIAPRTDPTPEAVLDGAPADPASPLGPGASIPSQLAQPTHGSGYDFGTEVGAWVQRDGGAAGSSSLHMADDGWLGAMRRGPLEPGTVDSTEIMAWRPTLGSPRGQVFLGQNAYPENNQDDPRGVPEGQRIQRWNNRRMPRRFRRYDERLAGAPGLAVSAKEGPSLWEQRAATGQRYLTTDSGSARRRVTMTPALRRTPDEPSNATLAEVPASSVGNGSTWQLARF